MSDETIRTLEELCEDIKTGDCSYVHVPEDLRMTYVAALTEAVAAIRERDALTIFCKAHEQSLATLRKQLDEACDERDTKEIWNGRLLEAVTTALRRDTQPDSEFLSFDVVTEAMRVRRGRDELREKAAAFVKAFDACVPHINSSFLMAHVHGARYSGPTCDQERDALAALLPKETK